jgi:hypothetical protein
MERKLAHIEQILEINPIAGADAIVQVKILGWEIVVSKKDNFKVGDKFIYIETDSIVPDKPEFEFLRERKFRVRTIKLRGQISQGLVIPLPKDWTVKRSDRCAIGSDVTEELGITKYLSPSEQSELQREEEKIKLEKNRLKKFLMRYSWFRKLFLTRKQKNGFPYWVTKTDEERIQNMPQVLTQFADKKVYVTEKIDYQSGTWTSKQIPRFQGLLGKLLPLKKTIFVVCSRNFTTNDKNSLYWKIAKKYNLEKICKENPGIIIQGEQGDTKVQGNKYDIKEPTMWVFNIIDSNKNYYYDWFEMEKFCKKYNLQQVELIPFINEDETSILYRVHGTLSEMGSTVKDFIIHSKGTSKVNPKIYREGIVVRCIENGKKLLSFKVINPDFLLKYQDEEES